MKLNLLQSKKRLFIIGLIMVFLFSFSLYMLYLNNSQLLSNIKNKITVELEEKFNIDVEVEKISLVGFNKMQLKGFKIKDLNESNYLFQTEKVIIDYSWTDLLFNSLKPLQSIKEVNIVEPAADLIKENGKWNYQFLQSEVDLESDSFNPTFDFSIYLSRGNVNINSPQFKNNIDNINGKIKVAEKLEVNLSAELAGLSGEKVKLNGEFKDGQYSSQIDFKEVDIEKLSEEINFKFADMVYKGNLKGQVKFTGRLGSMPTYYGDLFLKEAAVEYKDIKVSDIKGRCGVNNYGIKIKELSASYKEAPFTVKGEIFSWERPQLNLSYDISRLNLKELEEVLPPNLQLVGIIKGEGKVKGELKAPSIMGEINLEKGEANGVPINSLSSELYYKEGILNLKQLDMNYKGGQISGNGTINLEEPFNYMLSVKFKELDLKEFNPAAEYNLDLMGTASGEGVVSGQGFEREELNVLGSLSAQEGLVSGYPFEEFKSNFWLNEGKLFLNQAQLATTQGKWNLEGIVSLAGDLDLTVEARRVNLARLEQIHNLNKLEGLVNLKGNIVGDFSTPKFKGEFNLANLAYDKFNLTAANGRVSYSDKVIDLEEVEIPEANTKLMGRIDFKKQASQITLTTMDVKVEKLLSVSGVDVEVTGLVNGKVKIENLLSKSQPLVRGNVIVRDGIAYGQPFDWTEVDFAYKNGELMIDELESNYKDSTLQAQGKVAEGRLNLNFTGRQIDLQHVNLPPKFKTEIKGKTKIEGRVYGDFSDLEIGAEVKGEDMQFAQYNLGEITAQVHYKKPNLHVKNGRLEESGNVYKFKGGLDLYQQKFNNFAVDVLKGDFAYLNQFLDSRDIDLDHKIQGRAEINGLFYQPRVRLDLDIEDIDEDGRLKVMGNYWAKNGLDMEVTAYQFALSPINKLEFLQEFDLLASKLAGNLNFRGKITGDLKHLNLNSHIKVAEGQIGNLHFEELTGPIKIIEGEKMFVQQKLQVKGKNVVRAHGVIPFTERDKFNLNVNLEEGSLSLLSLVVDELKSAQGRGKANIKLTGPRDNLQVKGNAQVIEGSLDHPLFDSKIKRLSGKLDFTGNQIKVNNLTGNYGKGKFEASGQILLKGYVPEDFDLVFTGKDIIFEHGSWRGENDVDLKIQGNLNSPLIKGTILAKNTMFSLPVKWPVEELDSDFTPRFDLEIKPRKNVKVGNENIDILVQEGILNVTTNEEEKIELTGNLKSTNGRFTYYNTEFEVVEADAKFNKYDYMPTLDIKARTLVQGTEIYLDLVGPTENTPSGPWEVSFSSDPPLTRREIINLLTRQGGIGNLLEKDYEQAVKNELWRIIGQGIKTELIYKVERSFERSLNIDQFRIKSLLEEDELVEIKVGKFIFDGFMLKYNRTFGMDIRQSLGFEYSFTEGLDNLKLSGNYEISEKEEDFNLGMEITIPF